MKLSTRFQMVSLETEFHDLKRELRDALQSPQKSLPCKWLYDGTGSHLFEKITRLPEYYLTRTEAGLLKNQAGILIDLCPPGLSLVELGSGSSKKTHYLINEALQRQTELQYYGVDVSPEALDLASDELLGEYENLRFTGLVGEFAAGLRYLAEQPNESHLVAFLGSTIGNLTDEEMDDFFTMLRISLRPCDRFLLGFDLLKDSSMLLPAYNDSQGITAAFNVNLLRRLNREFGADFDLSAFEHNAIFNSRLGRMEMHLVSKKDQQVSIPDLHLKLDFEKGETIHTENSYKHSQKSMQKILREHGFDILTSIVDSNKLFSLLLVK